MSPLDMPEPGASTPRAAGPAIGSTTRLPQHASIPTLQSSTLTTARNIQPQLPLGITSHDRAPVGTNALGPGFKGDPLSSSPNSSRRAAGPSSSTRLATATQLPQASNARFTGQIDFAPTQLRQHPDGINPGKGATATFSTPALPQPQPSSYEGSTSDAPHSPSHLATTPVGDLLWTASEDSCLLGSIERNGANWDAVRKDFLATGGHPRSAQALRVRWSRTLSKGTSSPQLMAAKQAVEATAPSRRAGDWTQEESDILRRALVEKKPLTAVYESFEAHFQETKRTREAIRRRLSHLRTKGCKDGDLDDEREAEEEKGGGNSDNNLECEDSGYDDQDDDIEMAAPSTSRAGRVKAASTTSSVQRHDGWTESEDRLLLDCVARHRSHRVVWTKVLAEFSKANHRERSKAALETRWHTLRRHAGAGSSSKTKGVPRHQSSGKQGSKEVHAAGHPQRYEAYNDDPLMTYAKCHQYSAEDHASQVQPLASFAPRLITGQHLHAPLIDLNLAVGISYEQNGVRIDGCVPGLEIMVFSATCVKISGPGHTTAESEQLAFHLRIVDGGGVVGVRVPHGTTQSIGLVPRQEEGGFAVGAAGGLARGMAVQTSYVSAEGFSIVLIS